jgi:hypothetical protein
MTHEPGYLEQCLAYGGGPGATQTWLELEQILGHREMLGWRFEVINPDRKPEATWSLGLEGANRLIVEPLIAVDGVEGVYVFDSDHDEERRFLSIQAFVTWLDEHEHEYEGLTNLQKRLLDDLLEINRKRWREEQGFNG